MFRDLRGIARLSVPALVIPFLQACGGGGSAEPVDRTVFFPPAAEEWEMVFEDDFNGTTLNTANWTPQLGDGSEFGLVRWGNNEEQWYLAENAVVEDGLLKITAKTEEVVPGFPYTSARIRSATKFDFEYGRVEMRAKAAPGKGLWTAGWLLPTDSPYGIWASIGEVDVMEIVNATTEQERVFQTLHYGFPFPLNQETSLDVEVDDPSGDFHDYAIEWSSQEIRWFVDGVHTLTIGSDHFYNYYYESTSTGYKQGRGDAPFDVPFHLILNLAVGGNLPGVVEPGDIPSTMEVDYVRVFKCAYREPGGIGCNSKANRELDRPDAQDPFEASFPLYTDAAAGFDYVVGGEQITRQLAVNSFFTNDGALSFMEVAEEGRGNVIEVVTSNFGNISLNMTDGEPTTLFGFGNNPAFFDIHAGSLSFDMFIDSAGTDLDSSFLIKMDSTFPALGFKELKVADLPKDQWFTYHVQVNDLLANSGERPLDTSAINSFFVFEPTSAAHVKIDNITLACGHPARNGCGIRPPGGEVDGALVPVYVDGQLFPLWDKGICGSDTGTGFTDYCNDGNTFNKINWSATDSGDPDIGIALNVEFRANGEDGVFFFGSGGGVDLSGFENGGKLRFDINVPPSTAAAGMIWKVDCFFPCSTGDQVLDLTDYTPGTWKSFEFDVSTLRALGLDTTQVNAALVLFPTFGDQQGYTFQVANVRYEVDPDADGGDGDGGSGPAPLVVFDDGMVGADFSQGIVAFDEALGFSDCNPAADCPSVTTSLVEDDERGTVLEVSHGAPFAGIFFGVPEPGLDLRDYADGFVQFDIEVQSLGANSSGFLAKVDCFFPCGAADQPLGLIGTNGWETVRIPVSDLIAAGLDVSKASNGLVFFPAFGETDGVVYRLDNVFWTGPNGLEGGGGGGAEVAVFTNGVVDARWDRGLFAFDEGLGFSDCDPFTACPNVLTELVEDEEKGTVIQLTHGPQFAGVFFGATEGQDLSEFVDGGVVEFEMKVTSLGTNTAGFLAKVDCFFPCGAADQPIGTPGLNGWEVVQIPVAQLVSAGLDPSTANNGLVIFPAFGETNGVVWRLTNVRWYFP